MTGNVLVGIDAGLTNITVTAFDSEGAELAAATRSTPRNEAEADSDREEQEHDRLYQCVSEAISAVVTAESVPAHAIGGVGVAGHGHGLYGVDGAGKPACGIKSTDSRAIDTLSEECSADALSTVVDRLGWEPFGADPLSLLVWLQRHDPTAYDRLETILFCKDVLTYRLTGELATDPMEGSVFYGHGSNYDEEIFTTLGIEDAFAALPPVVPSTESCGVVTSEAATRTGLPAGTPVASGLQDVGACTLGAGLADPGDGLVILGTWGQSVALLDAPSDGAGGLPRRYLDGWLRYEGLRSGAACVEWFVEDHGTDWRREARELDVDPYEVYERTVAGVSPGAEGLIFHPFLQGSTDDPDSAGGFYGLRLDHTKAHMLRAIYEGVAVAQVESLDGLTTDIDAIRLTGGGARSESWAGMVADIADARVTIPDEGETGALGAALCAGIAAGVYPDIEAALDRAVGISRTYDPDPDATARYRLVRKAFAQAIDGMEPTWETLKSLN